MLFRLHTFTSLILYVILLKMRNGMRYASVAFWICCLAVLLSTTSCSKSRDERPWGEYAESSLVFQPLPITPLLGSPYSIDVIDSVLVIADKVEDRTLLLYNMKDSTYVRTTGRADLRIHRTNQCESICSSQNYFYVLYDGNRMDSVQRKDYRSILCFDAFTGELKHVYRVDPTVCGICVSNQKMYALLIGEDGEYMIGVTALDDLSLN